MATEKRLIDPERYEAILQRFEEHLTEFGKLEAAEAVRSLIKGLKIAPTVDAVMLPCKIGDKVYRINEGNYYSNWKPFVQEITVTEISWKREKYGGKDLGFAIIADGIRYKFTSIGKSVFLTRKEAEAKMEGNGNG